MARSYPTSSSCKVAFPTRLCIVPLASFSFFSGEPSNAIWSMDHGFASLEKKLSAQLYVATNAYSTFIHCSCSFAQVEILISSFFFIFRNIVRNREMVVLISYVKT